MTLARWVSIGMNVRLANGVQGVVNRVYTSYSDPDYLAFDLYDGRHYHTVRVRPNDLVRVV